jgi:putative glutamine amidotransferase
MSKIKTVLIPANTIDYDGLPAHVIRDTYARAVFEVCGAVPLVLPVLGKGLPFDDILAEVDGVMLTGSPSHLAPACYGAPQSFPDKDLDVARDSTTLPLIGRVIALDKPMLAICRGFQELNVAQGGTLHQKIHGIAGKQDHRSIDGPLQKAYEHQAHKIIAEKGGVFEKIGLPATFTVNSLHQQGIDKLGRDLHVEARAEDGIIEAVSIPGRKFVLGTQYHPEADWKLNPQSVAVLKAFAKNL